MPHVAGPYLERGEVRNRNNKKGIFFAIRDQMLGFIEYQYYLN